MAKVLVSRPVAFEQEIARLNKQAERIGYGRITFTRGAQKMVQQTRICTLIVEGEASSETHVVPVQVTEYEVSLPDMAEYAWRLVAQITEVEGGKPFIDPKVKGFDAAKWAQATPGWCEHCKTNRKRKFTYVVEQKSNGEQRQVGRVCFADYVGLDGLRKLEFQDLVSSLLFGGEDDFIWGDEGGRARPEIVPVRDLIAVAEALRLRDGWINNDYDEYGELRRPGTHRMAADIIKGEREKILQDLGDPNHPAWRAADEIIERLKGFDAPEDDEFALSLSYCSQFEFVPKAKASMVAYSGQFLRNHDRKIAWEARKLTMQHVGTVGKREDFRVTVDGITTHEGQYGTTYIVRMTDAAGNALVWFASNPGLDEGKTYTLKATVKEHGEFNGAKQTIISRGKVVA